MSKAVAETVADTQAHKAPWSEDKTIKPIKMHDLVAANAVQKSKALPSVSDIEDMWDNLPV